jgi:plasmid stabilization system protein ParE
MAQLTFRFLPEAREELYDASEYYERRKKGLGREFELAVYAAIDRICQNPQGWGSYTRRCRRYLVRRFPYAVVYQVHADHISIVAVMHFRRRPGYWRSRIEDP